MGAGNTAVPGNEGLNRQYRLKTGNGLRRPATACAYICLFAGYNLHLPAVSRTVCMAVHYLYQVGAPTGYR